MLFFDYIFYRVGAVYKTTQDRSPEFAAVCVVSLIEILNAIFLIGIYEQIFHFYFTPNKLTTILGLITVLTLNAFRYNKLDYDSLNEKWGKENIEIKKRKGTAVFVYIFLSVITVIGLIIWRANIK